jgi:diaminopimelate decarboxylase
LFTLIIDIIGKDRTFLSKPSYDDVILICNAGAYGLTMSSDYNMRKKPKEIFLNSKY